MRCALTLAVAIGLLATAPVPASAQVQPTVTLSASATTIAFGERVTLSGTVTAATAGTSVEIVDATGGSVATAPTDASGTFNVTIAPEGTTAYRAVVGGASSEPVTVHVRAVVTVRMSPVRLFDSVRVEGRVEPVRPGRVEVMLSRGSRAAVSARVPLDGNGGFRATLEIDAPGSYRARASFSAADLLRGSAVTRADATPLPRVSEGDSGRIVQLLEARLAELRYRLSGASDGRYDDRTADAVVAFHKVQRMDRSSVVTSATWRRLADPIEPRARRGWRGFHIEVDQTRQVLYTVQDGEITNVLHVSTGAGGATHDGTFRVFRKLSGFSPNHLYYPSYFDGLRALHGWTEVPTYPASHGCVRIPYWNATWVFALADLGTPVLIYH
jgi:hypothetical protein